MSHDCLKKRRGLLCNTFTLKFPSGFTNREFSADRNLLTWIEIHLNPSNPSNCISIQIFNYCITDLLPNIIHCTQDATMVLAVYDETGGDHL